MRRVRLESALCAITLVLLGLWMAHRLVFGVDFTDEAVYAAIPRRFVLGDQPFVDELNPIQTASLEVVPFYWLFWKCSGGFEGLVLFGRWLYLVFVILVALLVARGCAPLLGGARAALVASALVLFVPLGIPALSYNTLGLGFFAAVIFLPLCARRERTLDAAFGAAGACTALATLALATTLLACLCAAGLALARSARGARGRRALLFACGALAVALLSLPGWIRVDASTLAYAAHHIGGGRGAFDKLVRVLCAEAEVLPRHPALLLGLGTLVFGVRTGQRRLALLTLAALPWTLLSAPEFRSSLELSSVLAQCGPLLAALQWNDRAVRELFVRAWIPSALAGLVAAWTSSQLANCGCGHFPAALASSAAAVRLATNLLGPSRRAWSGLLACAFPLGVALLLVVAAHAPYRDDPLPRLTARIASGPFRGLWTTPEKRAWWEHIAADVRRYESAGGRILFALSFPAGYLASCRQPAASSVWAIASPPLDYGECTEAYRRDLEHYGRDGVVVFYLERQFFWRGCTPVRGETSVGRMLRSEGELLAARADYSVYLWR